MAVSSHQLLVGTADGLFEFGARERAHLDRVAGSAITALAREAGTVWALAAARALHRLGADGEWTEVARVDGPEATCLAASPLGLLVGTAEAHLLRLDGDVLRPIEAFDTVDGRDAWYTPWGDPADVRSISAAPDGAIYVNVHVGGVVRSRDGGRTWQPTLDIEADVHQVLAHPGRAGFVAVAAAVGFGRSRDGGDTWEFATAGLHAHYLRAVAFAGDHVLVSASTGPSARRGALYRRPLDEETPFARCAAGLPRWFTSNLDTACLAAAGSVVVAGTDDGDVYVSEDAGTTWSTVAKGLPAVRCVAID